MPEVRVRSLVILVVLVGGGVLAFVFFGTAITIFFWDVWAKARGYTGAKTPSESMEKFREAIHNRDYDSASRYTSKDYAEILKKAHEPARLIGGDIDKMYRFGDNHGILSDRTKIGLARLDPFPKNFKVGKVEEDKSGTKATGTFIWEPPVLSNPAELFKVEAELLKMDAVMYSNVLAPAAIFAAKIELVKENDEWKLQVPTNDAWHQAVRVYIDKHKTYHTGLNAFISNMTREQYADKGIFERGIYEKLSAASK